MANASSYLFSSDAIPIGIRALGSLLERAVQRNEIMGGGSDPITAFHGRSLPEMSILPYINGIYRFAHCSSACWVVAYLYLERFLQSSRGSAIRLEFHTVQRLFLASILAAIKFLDGNRRYRNQDYALIGGVSVEEINKLERSFLSRVDYRLHVTEEEFYRGCLIIQSEINYLSSPIPASPWIQAPLSVSGSTPTRLSAPSHFGTETQPILTQSRCVPTRPESNTPIKTYSLF